MARSLQRRDGRHDRAWSSSRSRTRSSPSSVEAVEDAGSEHGRSVLVASTHGDPDRESASSRSCCARRRLGAPRRADRRRPLLARGRDVGRSCSSTVRRRGWTPTSWASTTSRPPTKRCRTSSLTGTVTSPTSGTTRTSSPPRHGWPATARRWRITGCPSRTVSSTRDCPTAAAAADAMSRLLAEPDQPTAVFSAATRCSLGVVPDHASRGADGRRSRRASATSPWPTPSIPR